VQFPWAQVAGSGAPHEDSYRLQDNLRLSAADALDRGGGYAFSRAFDIIEPDYLTISPSVPTTPYRDGFGWTDEVV
jgi:hypothetical protein